VGAEHVERIDMSRRRVENSAFFRHIVKPSAQFAGKQGLEDAVLMDAFHLIWNKAGCLSKPQKQSIAFCPAGE
jgi:hypothetical protein